ncbi:MAG: nuclear transport factor 2 family protein [Acidimicrobiia bacterium]
MQQNEVKAVVDRWVRAWNGDDPAAVHAQLHPDITVSHPGGEVGPEDAFEWVATTMKGTLPAIVRWYGLDGGNSVAVVGALASRGRQVDTLVLADDGRVVRLMRHHVD